MNGYHGDRQRQPREALRFGLWVSLDREYAECYADGGTVHGVDLAGLEILDLSGLGISPTSADLREALDAAGVDAPKRLGFDGDDESPRDEMRQRIERIEDAVLVAGFDGIQVCEWTDGIGETVSVLLFVVPGSRR